MNTTEILTQLGWSEELIKAVAPALAEPPPVVTDGVAETFAAEELWVYPSEPVLVSGITQHC